MQKVNLLYVPKFSVSAFSPEHSSNRKNISNAKQFKKSSLKKNKQQLQNESNVKLIFTGM